jgi:hypothetical protein
VTHLSLTKKKLSKFLSGYKTPEDITNLSFQFTEFQNVKSPTVDSSAKNMLRFQHVSKLWQDDEEELAWRNCQRRLSKSAQLQVMRDLI